MLVDEMQIVRTDEWLKAFLGYRPTRDCIIRVLLGVSNASDRPAAITGILNLTIVRRYLSTSYKHVLSLPRSMSSGECYEPLAEKLQVECLWNAESAGYIPSWSITQQPTSSSSVSSHNFYCRTDCRKRWLVVCNVVVDARVVQIVIRVAGCNYNRLSPTLCHDFVPSVTAKHFVSQALYCLHMKKTLRTKRFLLFPYSDRGIRILQLRMRCVSVYNIIQQHGTPNKPNNYERVFICASNPDEDMPWDVDRVNWWISY